MNKISYDIMNIINDSKNVTQREISEKLGVSLGKINGSYKELVEQGLIENDLLTVKGKKVFEDRKPKNAIILAAGFGMRMVPINTVKRICRKLVNFYSQFLMTDHICILRDLAG